MVQDIFDQPDLTKPLFDSSDVDERIDTLNKIEQNIALLLQTASDALKALSNGKSHSNNEQQAKNDFQSHTKIYFSLLEEISVGLRREVRLFHHASREKILSIPLPVKADWIGESQQKLIWNKITELVEEKKENGEDGKSEKETEMIDG